MFVSSVTSHTMSCKKLGPTGRGRAHRGRRRGAILVVAAVVIVALIGMMALTLECGSLMVERRRAQSIADAAAMAAACDLTYNYGFNLGTDPQGTAVASALMTAADAGYANDGVTSTVTVNIPPKAGDSVGKAGYVEVLVSHNQARGFSAIFGDGTLSVGARSVARGQWQTYPIAFLALEPVLPAALAVALNSNLAVVNGDVDVDSVSPLSTAIALNARISAPTVNLTGNALTMLNGSITATVNSGVLPTADPLAYLDPPDPTMLVLQRNFPLSLSGTQTLALQPGLYRGGIQIAGSARVTMAPGIYYMQGGGFTLAASGSLTGTGVTIVNAPVLPTDAISIAASGTVQLSPPTAGLYAGITIMQPPELVSLPLGINPTVTVAANSLFGSSFSVSGTIYTPNSVLALAANGTSRLGSQVICRTATIAGNGSVQINWDQNTSRTPLPVKLVE